MSSQKETEKSSQNLPQKSAENSGRNSAQNWSQNPPEILPEKKLDNLVVKSSREEKSLVLGGCLQNAKSEQIGEDCDLQPETIEDKHRLGMMLQNVSVDRNQEHDVRKLSKRWMLHKKSFFPSEREV